MLKKEVVALYQGLNRVGNLSGVKFAYAVSRNLAILKPEIEALEKITEPTDEYKKFDEERVKLVEKFALKDDKGKAKMVSMKENPQLTEYVVDPLKQEELNKEFEDLKNEYKEAVEGRENQIKEYNELLNTESEIQLHKISQSEVPNQITASQMNSIFAIVDEEIVSPIQNI